MKPYTISKKEYANVQRKQMAKGFRLSVPLLVIVIALTLAGKHPSKETIISVTWPAVLGLVIGIFMLNKKIKSNYDSYKAMQKEYSVEFDESMISWRSDTGYNQKKWSDFVDHKSLKGMTLLYETKQLMYMIPHRAFENDTELKSFQEKLTTIR